MTDERTVENIDGRINGQTDGRTRDVNENGRIYRRNGLTLSLRSGNKHVPKTATADFVVFFKIPVISFGLHISWVLRGGLQIWGFKFRIGQLEKKKKRIVRTSFFSF